MNYVGKRVKIINTDGFPDIYSDLDKYIGKTGKIIKDWEANFRFLIDFNDDKYNGGLCFNISNIEIIENDIIKINNLTDLIKQIRNIIGNHWPSKIRIDIWQDEFYIYIYESEIPIVVNLLNKEVYINCEISNHHLN